MVKLKKLKQQKRLNNMTMRGATNKTDFTEQDHEFMSIAIDLAKKGHFTTSPNPRVGCVLVSYKDGRGKVKGKGNKKKEEKGQAEEKD